jgi:replicative DNA helicase
MSELSIIKHLCRKEFYTEHRDKIKAEILSKELKPILNTIDGYFKSIDDSTDLTVDDLSNRYFANNQNKADLYEGIFTALKANEAQEASTLSLIGGLHRVAVLRELSLAAYDAADGRTDLSKVIELSEGLSTSDEDISATGRVEDDFVSDDLVEIINSSRSLAGIRWRSDSLNKRLGSLRPGNFGFIFARPESGKTTFLASEVTHMAAQVETPILWFNNEQVGAEVMLRCYQAALGYNNVQLLSNLEESRKMFHEVTKGNIKIKDSASIHYKQVEKFAEEHKPSLIVFDQIDKIKGFDNDREDLRLGSIYIWARELAKKYCPVIGVCQADGSGEGQRWLTMANVANAKTSKQAEADWILGIGKVNDVGYENLRYLHLSKNKLWGDEDTDPKLRHDRWETLIEPEIGRFRDL